MPDDHDVPRAAARTVREIGRGELGALLALYPHLHGGDETPDAAVAQAAWDEAQANPRCCYFGGYAGDELVASCTITVIPNLTRGGRPYGVIENVVTHAAHRRRGWGQAVLAAALGFAESQRCYKVMLMTGRKDEAVYRFYESAGFDRHGKQAFVARLG